MSRDVCSLWGLSGLSKREVQLKARDSLEVTDVAGDELESVMDRSGCDLDVCVGKRDSLPFESRANLSEHAGGRHIEGDHRDRR